MALNDGVRFTPALSRRGLLIASGAASLSGALAGALPASAADDPLDGLATKVMVDAGVPGMAVAQVRDGVVRLATGYGLANVERGTPVTGRTVFHAASLTKPVVATVVAMLAEDGRLDLDGPVAPYLDFPVANPAHPDAAITFRHLAAHVSGISDKTYYAVDFRQRGRDATAPLETFLRDYLSPGGAHWSPDGSYSPAAPGTAWAYSNVGYALLGHAAGRAAGQDLRTFINARLFAPLGLRRTAWLLADAPADTATPYETADGVTTPTSPVGSPDWPASMLRASVEDYARFLAAASNRGVADGVRILSADGMAGMTAMATPSGLPAWQTGQGLGWQRSRLDGRELVEHWGGDPGVCNAAYFDPERRTGVVVLTNASGSREVMAAVKAVVGRLMA